MRVPSDNVPRRKSADVAPPEPEDPRLAAAVAYDFGTDSGRTPEDGTEPSSPHPEVSGQPVGEPTESGPMAHLEVIDASDVESDRADTVQPVVAQGAALAAAEEAPTTVDFPLIDAEIEEGDIDEDQLSAENSMEADGADQQVDAAEDDEVLDEDYDDAIEPDDPQTESVDIPIDDGSGGDEEAFDDGAMTDPEAQAPDHAQQSAAGGPSAAAAAGPSAAASAAPKATIRAQTVALSDADLEELADDELEDEPPAEAAMGGRVIARDPSDSGEFIDADMVEEVEDARAAKQADIEQTVDLDAGDDDVEELGTEEASEPPQLPAESKKPPPAPSKPAAPVQTAARPSAAATSKTGPEPKKKRGKPWFEEIFDEDYLRTLPFLTPKATQMEAKFVMDALEVKPGAQLLDIGCGYGRHALELAARGFHVVGLDSSLPLLLRGADEAQRRGLTINFVHGDMRDMAFDGQFDGAYCLFSTFGYFDDETNKRTAAGICRALKPGARCVFEMLNRDYIIGDLPQRVWWEGDGCVVLEEVDFNYYSSRIVSNRSVVFDDGRQLEQEISVRSFCLHELGKLLHSVGFRVVEVSGSMTARGRFFGAFSRDIVIVAERRVEKTQG